MLIDWNRINSLIDSESEADKKWLQDMIETLLTNMEERIQNIQKFTAGSDHSSLKSELHQMKGVAANFGLMELNDLILKSEGFIISNQFKDSFLLTNSIVNVWNRTKQELQAH